jgi:hypothetical protein
VAGSTLAELFSTLVNANNDNVDNIGEIASVSCNSVAAAFPANSLPFAGTDFAIGLKGGTCARFSYLELFAYVLTAGRTNSTIKSLFCDFVAECGAGLSCAPYDVFEVIVTSYDDVCSPIVGLEYSLS